MANEEPRAPAVRSALWEAVKSVVRTFILVVLPIWLAEVIKSKPEWGVYIAAALKFIDVVIHKLPNEYNGLLGF